MNLAEVEACTPKALSQTYTKSRELDDTIIENGEKAVLQTAKETRMELALFTRYPYSEEHITHSRFDYIYISPHLDDVPLSCSGTICRQQAQRLNILVVTIFAGEPQPPFSPFVQSVHRSWQAPDERPYQVRKEEERKAITLLRTDYAWLDWFEILYRDPELSSANDFFWEPGTPVVPPHDAALFATLCAWFGDASLAYPGFSQSSLQVRIYCAVNAGGPFVRAAVR